MEIIVLTVIILVVVSFLWSQRADPRRPPTPVRPLPLVGHLLYLQDDMRTLFKKWRQQTGDLFSINILGTKVVVLNGYDLIREALVKKADYFSDRPPVFLDKATGFPGKGVMFSSGHIWKEQRSVALNVLRQFGMGKNILADKIQEEVSAYVTYLASMKDHPLDIKIITNISAANIICSIIIGHRFEYDDKDFRQLMTHLNSTASDQQNVSLINFVSWLEYLPGDLFKAKRITQNVKMVFSMLQRFIKEKRRDDVHSSDADNFIDAYIADWNKKSNSGISTTMDDENLAKSVIDLFNAGTETTSTTLLWFVLYMISHPDVQEKVFLEIKEVIGLERLPTIQDRPKLTYLNAVILETLRLGSIVPLSLPHKCSEDVTLGGYTIAKDSLVLPNLDSVLHDKTIWGEDAGNFRPERFLGEGGKLIDRPEMVAFSIGRRICLGESMAQTQLFLFLSNLLQRFQFLPKDNIPPSYQEYNFGITCCPRPYEVRLVDRKQI